MSPSKEAIQRSRRVFTPEQKATILRRHLGDKVPVSDLCDEYQLAPSLFYLWQTQALEHLTAALQDGRTLRGESQTASADRARIAALEATIAKKDRIIAEVSEEYLDLKKSLGPDDGTGPTGSARRGGGLGHGAPRAHRVAPAPVAAPRLGIARTKFLRWSTHYGRVPTPHGPVPREHWLTQAERDRILSFHAQHPLDGYRALAYLMLDAAVVAVSPTSVYRVLKDAGRLDRWTRTPSKQGTGFVQPTRAHEHWHIDFTYVNIAGTFYYLCAILDGATRYLVHWELREAMKTRDVTTILQRAHEKFPDAHPRLISDNGPQFIARDFRDFIRLSGMTHVRTAPYYPQSNGKIERWNQTLKVTTIRPQSPTSLEDARHHVTAFVTQYNQQRLHSALGYITPADCLAGRSAQIWATRDQRLEAARMTRQLAHRTAAA